MKRVLILDLDNTIYPVSQIADHLFGRLFTMIDEELAEEDRQAAEEAKHELTRRPYQQVADDFGFSNELKTKGLELLKNCTYDLPMQPYDEYDTLRNIAIDKFLVTTGFTKLQMSKVKMLDIAADFKQVYVVDPEESDQTKGDIFNKIMQENGYALGDVLVIGDDPKSEIKFAKELGIETFLFDPESKHPDAEVTYRGTDYSEIERIIAQ
ncbi:HAD family hydrolase [Inquilinus sp. KBS0705]|nr:HAD family hydrolase [Inquilinus sp. KBS0705]